MRWFRLSVYLVLVSIWLCRSSAMASEKPVLYFWYGCDACYQLERYLQKRGIGADWKRLPATVYRQWRPDTKLFVVFQRMQVSWVTQIEWMAVATSSQTSLPDSPALNAFLGNVGIDKNRFKTLWQDAVVNAETTDLMRQTANVRHVPSAQVGPHLIDGADYPSMEAFVEAILAAQISTEATVAP